MMNQTNFNKRKKIITLSSLLLFFMAIVPSCSDGEEETFHPGGSKKPDIEVPKKALDYSQLTAVNHPRLLMNTEDFTALKAKITAGTDANLTLLHNTIIGLANSQGMASTTLVYQLDASNKRILDVSRNALLRIFSCAYAYRMTGDAKYLTHAEADLNTVCNFPDWNAARHFLDVGEMAAGVALGYDWLYNELSPATKTKAAQTILSHAFTPARNKTWNLDFYAATNNWNQVCNGGLVCAAIAIYETTPAIAKEMIETSVASNAVSLQALYSPDGNYPEGAGYWCYGTTYQVLINAALESSLGMDAGLSDTPGFARTAEYMLFMTGLNNKFFNYSDCAQSSTPVLATWWFAAKYNNPSLLCRELQALNEGRYTSSEERRLLPMLMAFAGKLNLTDVHPPTDKIWSGRGETPVVLVHTDWTYSDTDKYLGIKGGRAHTSHGHMDAGSFVYDAYGQRWAMDFGLQSYTTLETPLAALGGSLFDMEQNSMRWNVFRLNNMNHNTITINGALHRVNGFASLTSVLNSPTELGGVFDLTDVVSDQAASAVRTVKIVNDKDLVVIDAIRAKTNQSANVRWCMVTPAVPTVGANGITLTNGNKVMNLTTTADLKVNYKQWSTTGPNTYDAPNPGTYMVGFEASVTANQLVTFTTTLSPK